MRLFNKLPQPKDQQTEVLYILLKRGQMSRREFMIDAWVLNAPNQIMELRRKGVQIKCHEIKKVNKYGRDIEYGSYELEDKPKAREQYLAMLNN